MPELAFPKYHEHPLKNDGKAPSKESQTLWPYVELHCKTNFSFLRGASHPDELVNRADELGYRGLAVTDRNTLAGVVRMHIAAKNTKLPLIIGAEIVPTDASPLILIAPNRAAYGRLSRLITVGRRRSIKGDCRITVEDIADHAAGLIAICLPYNETNHDEDALVTDLHRYRELFAGRVHLAAELNSAADDITHLAWLDRLARRVQLPLVATGNVHYHDASRRPLHDVLTCIRHQCTIHEAGTRLLPHARLELPDPFDLYRRYATHPQLLQRTLEIAAQCTFSLGELRYEYPPELCPEGKTPNEFLRELTWKGANKRYDNDIPARIVATIHHELELITDLKYEAYFLTVWDIVRFARERDILCQGRGSAANSTVCYCLGVTSVDPTHIDLLFERFLSRERNEPPDIDVDFEHERREEVFQYIYAKYGRDRAAITAEVITYRPRSAVRDVGKALGLSLDCVDAIAKRIEGWHVIDDPLAVLRDAGIDSQSRPIQHLLRLVNELAGFPRHLSQHVGGFVMTAGPLCETVPILNGAMPDRTFVEWDKDDLDALGMLKVDCLALGMLTCISKCFRFVRDSTGCDKPMDLTDIESDDPAVYDMICAADTIGVFQIESRAQMSMLPRLRPRNFYDLVIEVAIVRPGPIQGGMVHPYLRRRNGEEKATYPKPELETVLAKTLGVPLFQEQAMRMAIVAAGFTEGEADQLRRAMAAWKRHGGLEKFHAKFIGGMLKNGYEPDFAERCFDQIRGFGDYGFPESHAASFALLVYVSAWLKCHYPAEFAAALLNSQPMGFYAPAQIVRHAIQHGVKVLGPDVNRSNFDCTLENHEGESCLRLGLRMIKGTSEKKVAPLTRARMDGPFGTVRELAHRSQIPRPTLARLAAADAFQSIGLNRREALWKVFALDDVLDLFADLELDEPAVPMPHIDLQEQVIQDYSTIGMSLTAHPVALIRDELTQLGVRPNIDLRQSRTGQRIRVAGLVICRQRPSTAKGIVFMTLEDETAIANLIIKVNVWKRYRRDARGGVALVADGEVQRQGEVINIQVTRIADASSLLRDLRSVSRDFH